MSSINLQGGSITQNPRQGTVPDDGREYVAYGDGWVALDEITTINIVESVRGGNLINVDLTDPINPIVNFDANGNADDGSILQFLDGAWTFVPRKSFVESTGLSETIIINHTFPYRPHVTFTDPSGHDCIVPFCHISDTELHVGGSLPPGGLITLE